MKMRAGSAVFLFMLAISLHPVFADPSIKLIQFGISGDITTDIITDELDEGKETILIGTSAGVYILSGDGNLERYIQTAGSVTNIGVLDDLTGDGRRDIVITTSELHFPNVLGFDSRTGEKIWEFSSKIEVCDTEMLWTMQQNPVFDLKVVQDKNRDGYGDIAISSGYSIFLLSGKTGKELWRFESSDNIWRIEEAEENIIAGDQNGCIHMLRGDTGDVIWSKPLSKSYAVVNPVTKQKMGEVERSVWDIIVLDTGNRKKILVTAEDGNVYLIDLETGNTEWPTEIIEYSDTLLYQYYGDYPLPTSSADYNFFNMRAMVVDDCTGDGRNDILVYTYPGHRLGREYQGAIMGLYLLDSDSGKIIWLSLIHI